LQQNVLEIGSNLIVTNAEIKSLSKGDINFVAESVLDGEIIAPRCNFGDIRFLFSGSGSNWKVSSDLKIEELKLVQGSLSFGKNVIETGAITLAGSLPRSLTSNETLFLGVKRFSAQLQLLSLSVIKSKVNVSGTLETTGTISNGGLKLPFEFVTSGRVQLLGSGVYESLSVTGEVEVQGSNTFNKLVVSPGSELRLGNGTTQKLSRDTQLNSSALQPITIRASNRATLDFSGHYKLCFDFLNIISTDLTGSAVINAGAASVLSASSNWFALPCADVLFPDFDYSFACRDGLTQFVDMSSGLFDQRAWTFGTGGGSSIEKNPAFQFIQEGPYTVTLTLSKGGVARSFSQSIEVVANSLPVNEILFSSSTFFSTIASTSYQWYKDMVPIEGAKNRSYQWNGDPGQFFVLIANDQCNRPSNTMVITGLAEAISEQTVFPNPADATIFVRSEAGAEIDIVDTLGRTAWSGLLKGTETRVNTGFLPSGVYFVRLKKKNSHSIHKISIVH
jgi:hypothetical protein